MRISLILLLLALFSSTNAPQYKTPSATTSEYDVDIEYPNIQTSIFAFFAGIFGGFERPDKVFYEEKIFCDTSVNCFELKVRTDEDKIWLFIDGNDTLQNSFSDLPRDEKVHFLPDAIDFITKLRSFADDSCGTTFKDTFFYDDKNLEANVEQRLDLNRNDVRYIGIETHELGHPEIPYVSALVTVTHTTDVRLYPSLFIHLMERDIKINLSLSDIHPSQSPP